jgi:hypothetical protein
LHAINENKVILRRGKYDISHSGIIRFCLNLSVIYLAIMNIATICTP